MENDDRIFNSINRIAPSVSKVGKDDSTALSTKEGYVYRETGFEQIADIIDCGYVRSNAKRKSNQVWWTYGGKNSFHINKRPVLVASTKIVKDFLIGAISLNDLTEIWVYNLETQTWNNKIEEIKAMYFEKHHDFDNEIKQGKELM